LSSLAVQPAKLTRHVRYCSIVYTIIHLVGAAAVSITIIATEHAAKKRAYRVAQSAIGL